MAKQKSKPRGPRTFDGARMKDVRSLAASFGCTEKTIMSMLARGLLPHHRLKVPGSKVKRGRVIFLLDEVEDFLKRLPGLTPAEAMDNYDRQEEDL